MMRSMVLWGMLLFASSVWAVDGNEGGHSGDPYELDFRRRAHFVVDTLRQNREALTWQIDELERGLRELRVEVVDETLSSTGKVLPDPRRAGLAYVKLERAKYSQALRNRFSVDVSAFVAHEIWETRGLDIDRSLSEKLHFSEKAFENWHEGRYHRSYDCNGIVANGAGGTVAMNGSGIAVSGAGGSAAVNGSGVAVSGAGGVAAVSGSGAVVSGPGGAAAVSGNGAVVSGAGGAAAVSGSGAAVSGAGGAASVSGAGAVPSGSGGWDGVYYVALAYSPSTGRGGAAWYQVSRANAEAAATAACNTWDCRAVIWARSACAVIYRAVDNTGNYAWNWGTDRAAVESSTRAFCESRYGRPCTLVQSVCSG